MASSCEFTLELLRAPEYTNMCPDKPSLFLWMNANNDLVFLINYFIYLHRFRGWHISLVSKNIWKVLEVLFWAFDEKSFQEYVSQELFHQIFYGDLVCIFRRVKGAANTSPRALKNKTPSTSNLWTSDNREDYRSSAWHFYSLVYRSFPSVLHSD